MPTTAPCYEVLLHFYFILEIGNEDMKMKQQDSDDK